MKGIALFEIVKSVIALALPISGSRVFTVVASFIAMMMVAQLGETFLAAGFLAVTSSMTVLMIFSSIFYAVGIRIRFYRGQNNTPTVIGYLVYNAFFLALILGILAVATIMHLDKLLLLLGQNPQLVALTSAYFIYAGWLMVPLLLMMVVGQFYIGIGKSYFTLIVGMVSLPLTVLLSYALILGRLGLPQLGLAGVSLAQLLVQILVCIVSLIMLYKNAIGRQYQLFVLRAVDWRLCWALLRLGFPVGMQLGGELIAMALGNFLMGFFGVDAMAALQVTNQYSMIAIMLSFGLSQAVSYMVSEAYGKDEADSFLIKKYLLAAFIVLLAYAIPTSVLFLYWPGPLTRFYMGAHQASSECLFFIPAFFILAALFVVLDGVRNLLTSILRGLHDTKTASRINLLALWFISLPASALVLSINGGPIALRVGFLSGIIGAVAALNIYLYAMLTGRASKRLFPVTIRSSVSLKT